MPADISNLNEQISDLKGRIQNLQHQLKRSRILQDQNDELLRFEMLISELSTKFINLSAGDAKALIEYGLELMTHFLDVDQSGIAEYIEGQESLKTIYSYSRDEINSVIPQLPGKSFRWWTEQMRQGHLVVWRNLPDDAPPETSAPINKGFDQKENILWNRITSNMM